MNDSAEVQSPPSKRLKQAVNGNFVQAGTDAKVVEIEIEKENHPTTTTEEGDANSIAEVSSMTPSTPKRNIEQHESKLSTPKSASSGARKRTREEIEATKAEKEKKRIERNEKAEARKRRLEDEKRKRDEKREKEKLERDERKAKEIREKEERQKAQADQKAKRDEEKRLQAEEKAKRLQEKEDQKRKKEEEKVRDEKLKEEQKLAEEAKKKEAENKFKSFFSGKKRVITTTKVTDCSKWSAFEPKPNQTLAPTSFNHLSPEERATLDLCLRNSDSTINYLAEVKSRKPRRRDPFERLQRDDVKLVNPELEVAFKQGARLKLLQFHRNYRPAFYGTFRKTVKITGRTPYRKDVNCFDYEFDSDDEWEEPEDGEDTVQNEEQSDDDSDEDETDGMIVPHGYLSSDEEQHDENDAELFQSSVADRQKAKQAAYQKMRKKKLRKLEIKVRLNNGRDPILILAQQHFPVNPLRDYITVPKPKKEKVKVIKEKVVKEPKVVKEKVVKEKPDEVKDSTEKDEKDPKQPRTPKSSVSTPKTPKSASMMRFAKKVTSHDGLRTQLFNDSKRAQQRQLEQKKKQEAAKLAETEAKKKADELKKSQTKSETSSNGVNILTPKRKKKVAIRTLSSSTETKTETNNKPPENKEQQQSDPILIE